MSEHEGTRRVVYGDDGPTYVPVCPSCGRFVRADAEIMVPVEGPAPTVPNATCAKCGRVAMPCEGYVP